MLSLIAWYFAQQQPTRKVHTGSALNLLDTGEIKLFVSETVLLESAVLSTIPESDKSYQDNGRTGRAAPRAIGQTGNRQLISRDSFDADCGSFTPTSSSLLMRWAEAPNVVHQLPHLLVGQSVFIRLHVTAGPVSEDNEHFAIA